MKDSNPAPKKFGIPGSEHLSNAVRSFSLTEKVIFYAFACVFVASAAFLLWRLNKQFLVSIPASGGSYSEGIVGTPRFINPVLSISEIDKDLASLIYSGLLKPTPSGELVPDLAESYSVSEDGRIYTFAIKKGATFHDGTPVTADDVEFTVLKAQDNALKSPRKPNWEGVVVQKVDDSTVKFVLRQSYAPFIENATLGILPKHIWKDADADQFPFSPYNVKPVGSGPYKVDYIETNSAGVPTYYRLSSFKNYSLGEPYISRIVIRSYRNESDLLDAYSAGEISGIGGISPSGAEELSKKGSRIETAVMPRIYGAFFNQNRAGIFLSKDVRQALSAAADRQAIVDSVLFGYGLPIKSPFPPRQLGNGNVLISDDHEDRPALVEDAKAKLEKAGWKWNEAKGVRVKKDGKQEIELSFSLSTVNTPDLVAAAEILKNSWKEIGAKVDVKVFEWGDFNQNILRPRKYEALLFGEVIGRDFDPYAFWHSSQRNDPGLNIALYTNAKVDKVLEQARTDLDRKSRLESYEKIQAEIVKDAPAVFLFSPDYIYVVPPEVKNAEIGGLTAPSERFQTVHQWYIETNRVWKAFVN